MRGAKRIVRESKLVFLMNSPPLGRFRALLDLGLHRRKGRSRLSIRELRAARLRPRQRGIPAETIDVSLWLVFFQKFLCVPQCLWGPEG